MDDVKKMIDDRLGRISNLSERKLLKNVLYDVFENVVSYNMDMYDRLEGRIYDEIDDPLEKYYVYTSLDIASNIDPISEFLHPIIPSDIDDVIYDMEEISQKIHSGEELVLTNLFMKCDYLTLKDVLSSKKTYKGFIKTDKDIFEVRVYVRQSMKYIREIEQLYRIFQENGVRWNTINCPYAYKFIDVILDSSVNIKTSDAITEISIDLAEFDKYKVINAVPLWNIKSITIQDKSFPVPAKDRINFDHMISLIETGEQNGYLVGLENSEYMYCKRLESDLVVVSPVDTQHIWDLIQIESIENNRKNNYPYELVSNKRDLGFIGKYANVKSMVIRTKGEISRLLRSYEISDQLSFYSLDILALYKKPVQSTDFNIFIDDNIRVDINKKIMLIRFKPFNRENYLVYDKMSFLVSEIQVLFPEYKCIGELV